METNFNGLRAAVLEALANGLKRSPDAQIHLVYIPELSDPLARAGAARQRVDDLRIASLATARASAFRFGLAVSR